MYHPVPLTIRHVRALQFQYGTECSYVYSHRLVLVIHQHLVVPHKMWHLLMFFLRDGGIQLRNRFLGGDNIKCTQISPWAFSSAADFQSLFLQLGEWLSQVKVLNILNRIGLHYHNGCKMCKLPTAWWVLGNECSLVTWQNSRHIGCGKSWIWVPSRPSPIIAEQVCSLLICVSGKWFVFWKFVLHFGKLICVLVNWFVIDPFRPLCNPLSEWTLMKYEGLSFTSA